MLTYAKHGAQVIAVINNNNKYAMIKGFANIATPEENNDIGQDITMPDGSPFEYYKLPAVWGG